MSDLYRVTSPAIVIHLVDKGERYVYRDGIVDAATVKAGEIDRMIELGFVEQVAADDESDADPDAGDAAGKVPEGGHKEPATGAVLLDGLDLAGLRELAAQRGVDLQGATRKADIITALEAAAAS